MTPQRASNQNPFIKLIQDGRIHDLEGLKSSYRKIVMRTHPDAVSSLRLTDQFVRFSDFYEEAKLYLAHSTKGEVRVPFVSSNQRLKFYQMMEKLEVMDVPYAFHRKDNEAQIHAMRSVAEDLFREWNPKYARLHAAANEQHQQIWTQKPSGPYLKHALALNVRPVLHNIVNFHLTGRDLYRKQARQNIKAIMSKLTEEGYIAFKDYLRLLILDMENGAAVFQESLRLTP